MRSAAIPSFILYGEDLPDTAREFAHIETIAARSALHDWEIAPHRHGHSVQALLVFSGQVEFRWDGAARLLDAPCYMVVPIASVHGFRFTPSTQGYVLTLSAEFIGRAAKIDDPLLGMLTHGGAGALPSGIAERTGWLCQEMVALQADWRAPQPLFLALAEALVRSLPPNAGEDVASSDEERLSGFRKLIELHLREHRSVAWYAQQLNMTAKTLTRVCRRRLDCTPTELIHARLALEAQRLLTFTNASVVQVAEELGFSDASYFSRFYKRMTGRRPRTVKAAGHSAGRDSLDGG